MKKIMTWLLVVGLALALFTACGNKDDGKSNTSDNSKASSTSKATNKTNTTYKWPDNKWTQHMPKPTGALADDPTEDVSGNTSSKCWFTVIGNRDDAKAYVEQLKTYGYTEDPNPTIIINETDQEYRWDGISPAIDGVYHYYITVHHFVSEFGDNSDYDIIIGNVK